MQWSLRRMTPADLPVLLDGQQRGAARSGAPPTHRTRSSWSTGAGGQWGAAGPSSIEDRGKPAFSGVNSPTVPTTISPAAAPTVASEASTFLTRVTGRILPTRITLRHDGGEEPPGRGSGFTR